MALSECRECKGAVSTEAFTCPHCGAPQRQPPASPSPQVPPIISRSNGTEESIYSDNAVAVTTARVIIGGATYPVRNVSSVCMTYTPRRFVLPALLVFVGIPVLQMAVFLIGDFDKPLHPGITVVIQLIVAIILWRFCLRTKYHVRVSSAAGDVLVLTSKDKAYILRVVQAVNEAIARHP